METKKCKHCGSELSKIAMPYDSDWNVEYLMICMNDDCEYYKKGWDWMWNKYKQYVSYRYYFNTFLGTDGPFPIARPEDLKSSIMQ